MLRTQGGCCQRQRGHPPSTGQVRSTSAWPGRHQDPDQTATPKPHRGQQLCPLLLSQGREAGFGVRGFAEMRQGGKEAHSGSTKEHSAVAKVPSPGPWDTLRTGLWLSTQGVWRLGGPSSGTSFLCCWRHELLQSEDKKLRAGGALGLEALRAPSGCGQKLTGPTKASCCPRPALSSPQLPNPALSTLARFLCLLDRNAMTVSSELLSTFHQPTSL